MLISVLTSNTVNVTCIKAYIILGEMVNYLQ